jgi:hypothetical protein
MEKKKVVKKKVKKAVKAGAPSKKPKIVKKSKMVCEFC